MKFIKLWKIICVNTCYREKDPGTIDFQVLQYSCFGADGKKLKNLVLGSDGANVDTQLPAV